MSSGTSTKRLFQLLLGRNRYNTNDQVNFDIQHYIILGSIAGALISLYVVLLKLRLNGYTNRLKAIPTRRLPISEKDSRKMSKVILRELVRVDYLNNPEMCQIKAASAGNGDLGWGKETDPDVAGTHFSTSIATSFYVLEEAAVTRRPNLRHRNTHTIKEYIDELMKEFPALPADLCAEYLNTYGKYRFGNYKATKEDYLQFSAVVKQILNVITERSRDGH